MRFFKYINTIPENPAEGSFEAGDEIKVRKGSGTESEPYYWNLYKVAANGSIDFVRGITDEQNSRLERLSSDQISKVESITTGDITKLKEDYTKSEIDTKISDLGNLANSSKISLGNSTVLPVPPQSGGVTIPNAWVELAQNVTYTQAGGSPITGIDGHRSIAEWNDTTSTWSLVDMGELPQIGLADDFGNSTNEGATQRLVTDINDTLARGFLDSDIGNKFVKEIYLYGDTSNFSEYYLRFVQRDYELSPGQKRWAIEIANQRTGFNPPRICIKTWLPSEDIESSDLAYLNESGGSGIRAVLVVDWEAIPAGTQTVIAGKINTGLAFNPKFSPLIYSKVVQDSVYVSSSSGNDANTGGNDAPLLTINQALTTGKNIFLKSGDIFYENIDTCYVKIDKYGKGNEPIISGFKHIIKNNSAWELDSINIWKLDLSNISKFSGKTAHDVASSNIGLLFDNTKKIIYGEKIRYKADLSKNFQFYQTDKSNSHVLEDFRYVYMYLDSDPNILDLSLSTGTDGVFLESGGDIYNTKITGFGRHGINARGNNFIRENILKYIGGCTHSSSSWVRLGNGIEVNNSSANRENVSVSNNKVSNVYDCGFTVQGSIGGSGTAKNIRCFSNTFKNCRQSFEDFTNTTSSGSNTVFVDCVIEDNYSINPGDNGFNTPEMRDAHILSNSQNANTGMIYRNNIYIGYNVFLAMRPIGGVYKSSIQYDSKIYLSTGDVLIRRIPDNEDVLVIPENPEQIDDVISDYRDLTGDYTSEILVVTEVEKRNLSNLLGF